MTGAIPAACFTRAYNREPKPRPELVCPGCGELFEAHDESDILTSQPHCDECIDRIYAESPEHRHETN